jgi:hypothetical protein
MRDNVVLLRTRQPVDRSPACPAQFYKFSGDPAEALLSEEFLEKAAAFQEIRDCLVAADRREVSVGEAERRILHFVRAYLYADLVG